MSKIEIALFVLITAIALAVGFAFSKALSNKEIIDLQNQLAKQQGIVKIKEGEYETAALKLKKLNVDNQDLQKRLDETDRDARMYASMAFDYKNKFEYIKTHPKSDTIYVDGEPIVLVDSTERQFGEWAIPEYVYFGGRFQTVEPYRLYIDDFRFKFGLDILLTEDKNERWNYSVSCDPSIITPTKISVQVKPKPERWKYFFSGGVGFKNSIWQLADVDFSVGLGYKNWYGYIREEMHGNDTYTGIGIMKMFSF